jgi:hypothetical protein
MWRSHKASRHMTIRHMCILKKSLYGLNQEPIAWCNIIDKFLMSLGFTKSKSYSNLYLKIVDGGPVILLFYVDDMFLIGDEKLIT